MLVLLLVPLFTVEYSSQTKVSLKIVNVGRYGALCMPYLSKSLTNDGGLYVAKPAWERKLLEGAGGCTVRLFFAA
jgi:hypothetical protein